MLASGNLLKPSDGKPVTVPTQDMVLGSYYLTMVNDGDKGEGKVFRDENEAIMAYQAGVITLQAKIKVRRTLEIDGEMRSEAGGHHRRPHHLQPAHPAGPGLCGPHRSGAYV